MCLYKITPFYGSVFSVLSTSLHVCALSEKTRKTWEGYTVYHHSTFKVFYGPFILLAYFFLGLAGWGAY